MYLVFDTETNGLPNDYKAPATDLDNWPRVIQLAWQMYDEDGKLEKEFSSLIKPDGWVINNESKLNKKGEETNFWIKNGFSTEGCEENGVDLKEALEELSDAMDNSKYLVAHNMDFDKNIISAEFIRNQVKPKKKLDKLCTMKESVEFCRIMNSWGSGYKWPTLVELHDKLFNESFDGAHDALSDVKACARSFFELKKRSVMLKPKSTVHNLKTLTEYFVQTNSKVKTFEVRKNDRNYKVGDILILEEYNVEDDSYTESKIRAEVMYILSGGSFGLEEGYIIMSIKVLKYA